VVKRLKNEGYFQPRGQLQKNETRVSIVARVPAFFQFAQEWLENTVMLGFILHGSIIPCK